MRTRRLNVTVAIAAGGLWLGGCASPGDAPADQSGDPGPATASTPNEVTIPGLDYAFGGPRTLPPGPTLISFENRGEVMHEMILVRLREGVTWEQVMEGVQSGADPQEFVEGGPGILLAAPGETTESRLFVDLQPGRTYTLVCNLQDSEDDPPHVELGMVAAIEVTAE